MVFTCLSCLDLHFGSRYVSVLENVASYIIYKYIHVTAESYIEVELYEFAM